MKDLPSYLSLSDKKWQEKEEIALSLLHRCKCCPHYCQVDRVAGEEGICGGGLEPVIASAGPHLGEEPPVSGQKGSGTIFFSFCSMKCVYCQNYPFSQLGQGRKKSTDEIAEIMLDLQDRGCHNINLVTPQHYLPQITIAIKMAGVAGLEIPIVYNTSSFDSIEALSLIDGIADIYLADMRYSDPEMGLKYSGVRDYPAISRMAVKEMFRQVGPLITGDRGIAKQGIIIRHLVLPGGVAGSDKVFEFIAKELSKIVPISLMCQYFPTYRAKEFPEIDRPITWQEYDEALKLMKKYGLREGWSQGIEL